MTEPYRIRSPETWERAKADYLDGATAEEACRRHDLGLSALRRRARKEGWRRADQPDADPDDDDLDLYADVALDEMIDLAWRRMAQAVAHGRGVDAARWSRVHAGLLARAQAEADALAEAAELAVHHDRFPPPVPPPPPRPRLDVRGFDVHDVHPEISGRDPVNRAERRQLAHEARRRS